MTSMRVVLVQFEEGVQFLVCSTSKPVLFVPVDRKKNKKNATLHLNQLWDDKKIYKQQME